MQGAVLTRGAGGGPGKAPSPLHWGRAGWQGTGLVVCGFGRAWIWIRKDGHPWDPGISERGGQLGEAGYLGGISRILGSLTGRWVLRKGHSTV